MKNINEAMIVQSLAQLGLPKRAIMESYETLKIPYAVDLGRSGNLEPSDGYCPSGIYYPSTDRYAVDANTLMYAISKMSLTVYKRRIMVVELDLLIRQLNEGYTITPTYFSDNEYKFNEVDGMAILNFADETTSSAYTARELNRVKGLLTHMVRSGKGVHLAVTSPKRNIISDVWGSQFLAMLDSLEVQRFKLPLGGKNE